MYLDRTLVEDWFCCMAVICTRMLQKSCAAYKKRIIIFADFDRVSRATTNTTKGFDCSYNVAPVNFFLSMSSICLVVNKALPAV